MEYGLIPSINQYADNKEILLQQVQPSNGIEKLKNGDEAKQLQKDRFFKSVDDVSSTNTNDVKQTSETNRVDSNEAVQYQEVVLTNLNFGFNESSKDFYVRAIRGEVENQYPTDEMMRLKAYLIAQLREESA